LNLNNKNNYNNNNSMNGYKGFNFVNGELDCRGFKYEIGKIYELPEEKLKLCESGFHFCDNIKDVANFYTFSNKYRFCSITAFNNIQTAENTKFRNKYCCVKIRIDKFLDGDVDGYYFENGKFISTEIPYVGKKNKIQIENGYKIINSDENETKWYNKRGKLHREDGPAVENNKEGFREWYKNGKLHREDGPAYEDVEGVKEWYKQGKLHREDGPAIEYSNGTIKWYFNNILHRENGPAIEYKDGYKEWYINNKVTSREDIEETKGKIVEHSKNGDRYYLIYLIYKK